MTKNAKKTNLFSSYLDSSDNMVSAYLEMFSKHK